MRQFFNIRFTPMPAMEPLGRKRQYMILKPLTIWWSTYAARRGIKVPVGFIHNGPSIPNRLRGIVYYTHRLLRPSIVHDYLYSGWGAANGWTRKDADRLFLEGLAADGVGWLRRRVMFAAVRGFGSGSWKS